MPRMRRDACKRQSEVGLHRDLSDFETVAILRFGISNEPLDRRMHSRTGVKAEHSRVDFSRQEEKGPAGLGDVSFKIGSKVGDSRPSSWNTARSRAQGISAKR